jgi:hypothetical protein
VQRLKAAFQRQRQHHGELLLGSPGRQAAQQGLDGGVTRGHDAVGFRQAHHPGFEGRDRADGVGPDAAVGVEFGRSRIGDLRNVQVEQVLEHGHVGPVTARAATQAAGNAHLGVPCRAPLPERDMRW